MSGEFKPVLGPVMLWALGVGYVISGMYFGWNLGLPVGGPYGFCIATVLVTLMYAAFVLSYAELACALPRAGGAFVYATRALGPHAGLFAGIAQWVEFVFAPPAIAAAIGAYFHLYWPQLSPTLFGIAVFILFTALNIWGVRQAAWFELLVTLVAVVELLIFAGITGPHFSWAVFAQNPLPNGFWRGTFASLPFAIWFYLAIEGVANVAEETTQPERSILWGFGSALLTLTILAFLTLFCAVGVAGWEAVVYEPGTHTPSDSPLPLALSKVVGQSHPLYHMLVGVGLSGLLASFHGIILCAGRASFEFGRIGYAPQILAKISTRRGTPVPALLLNLVVGVSALCTGRTGDLITLSAFGAVCLYAISMWALLQLRKREPDLVRPFRVPLYPLLPVLALVLALVCLLALVVYYIHVALVFSALVGIGYLWYLLIYKAPARGEAGI